MNNDEFSREKQVGHKQEASFITKEDFESSLQNLRDEFSTKFEALRDELTEIANPIASSSDSDISPTGVIRVVQNTVNFQFELEEKLEDGSWVSYADGKQFKGVQDAKDWFILHQKALKFHPADLGNVNDAG